MQTYQLSNKIYSAKFLKFDFPRKFIRKGIEETYFIPSIMCKIRGSAVLKKIIRFKGDFHVALQTLSVVFVIGPFW